TVTDISGRGLGLAIVQEKVVKLNGTLTFDSRPNAGTTFRLVLPLTLATFRGVVIRCGEYPFIVPTVNVDRVLRIDRNQVKTVENCKTIRIRNELVALVKLAEVLELRAKPVAEAAAKMQVIVIGGGSGRIAFEVDEILNEQEVLVKPLGKQLTRVRNISGATILGTGQVAPILNVSDLLTSAMHWSTASIPRQTIEKIEEEAKSLLVVEDSITTRTLLKNILEASGYDVGTAVDGLDALTQLRERSFDLVVSDVMMPRLNGFELTAKIREDKRLTEIPVVLVTAQESLEDRERGIEVGANAYIVKSSFDQSNLLETIRRLV
ncbi:MAG: response regulator, partial [Methylococcaceae bacterium]|nr:response regulator [Methylococcaceae bacterium]